MGLQMTPALLYSLVIQPVVSELNWPQPTERAVLLLAIAIQESDLKHRSQWPTGPAKSWWQIELKTAVDCCTRCEPVQKLCAEVGSEYWSSDIAACAIAAGILRITPGILPKVGDRDGAWEYYLKAWRPGKPRPERWQEAHEKAVQTITWPSFRPIKEGHPYSDSWVSNT
jgi:hypothetical protein